MKNIYFWYNCHFSQFPIDIRGRNLHYLDYGLFSRITNDCQSPVENILSSINWLFVICFQEKVKNFTFEEMKQESPKHAPEQEDHPRGETKWETDSQDSGERKYLEFSDEF